MNIEIFSTARGIHSGQSYALRKNGQVVYKLPAGTYTAKVKKVYGISGEKQSLVQTSEGRVFFIGIDSDAKASPFATELSSRTLITFEQSGENAFFDMLVPKIIKDCMINFGAESYQRQGEVFTVKIADTWSEVRNQLGFTGHLEKCFRVFLHQITGSFLLDTHSPANNAFWRANI